MNQEENRQGENPQSKMPAGLREQEQPACTGAAQLKKEYSIDIFKDWCKQCGICAAFCPRECIKQDESGSPFVEDSERCNGCGWCELHCPDFAISVRPKRKKIQEEE